MKKQLTAERLREVLQYDSLTGVFTWRVMLSNKGPVGSTAGSADKNGYINIGLDNRDYKAHRLAWLYMTGEWPTSEIDHRNTISGDNAWGNLRVVVHQTNAENQRAARINNKTGLLGVSPSGKRFKAQIQLRGRQFNLGRYETAQAAHEVYLVAKRTMHAGGTL